MKFKLRTNQHLVRNSLLLHILYRPQTDISGLLIKGFVLFPYHAYVSAHGKRRNLCKGVLHRRIRIRNKDHVALLHRPSRSTILKSIMRIWFS